MKGLTTNIINISQLCYQGLKVNFTKSEFLVTNENNDILMRGIRSKDNCYLWIPQETTCSSTCIKSKEDEVKLWNLKLGHLNLKEISLSYSTNTITYRVFHSRTKGMMEAINVMFDDSIIVKRTDDDEDVGTSSQ